MHLYQRRYQSAVCIFLCRLLICTRWWFPAKIKATSGQILASICTDWTLSVDLARLFIEVHVFKELEPRRNDLFGASQTRLWRLDPETNLPVQLAMFPWLQSLVLVLGFSNIFTPTVEANRKLLFAPVGNYEQCGGDGYDINTGIGCSNVDGAICFDGPWAGRWCMFLLK